MFAFAALMYELTIGKRPCADLCETDIKALFEKWNFLMWPLSEVRVTLSKLC